MYHLLLDVKLIIHRAVGDQEEERLWVERMSCCDGAAGEKEMREIYEMMERSRMASTCKRCLKLPHHAPVIQLPNAAAKSPARIL